MDNKRNGLQSQNVLNLNGLEIYSEQGAHMAIDKKMPDQGVDE